MGSLRASNVGICLLEVLVPSVLESTLCRVAKEGWAPTSKDAAETLSAINLSPCFKIALVKRRVDLAACFDEIKRRYSRVSETLEKRDGCKSIGSLESKQIEYEGLNSLTHAIIPPKVHAA